MNSIVLKVVVQLTFMYSYNEGVRRWRDKPTVTVNQVSHVFCCGQWCRSDCEGLCTHIQISTREKDSALLHSDTMRALLWMSLTNAHMHAHTLPLMLFCSESCFKHGSTQIHSQEETHSSLPVPYILQKLIFLC